MFRKSCCIAIVSLIAVFFLLLNTPVAKSESVNEARILVVDPTNSSYSYTTISEAILSANESDIIYVNPGVYSEKLVINKSISIIGNDSGLTVIDSSGSVYSVLIKSSDVTISGLTISNSTIGVYINGLNNTVENCKISNNTNGIYLENSSRKNNFLRNNIINSVEAIMLYNSSYNALSENIVFNTTGTAIKLWDLSKNNKIENNTIIKCGAGIFLGRWSSFNKICFNNLSSELKKGNGLSIDYSYYNHIFNNLISSWNRGLTLIKTHDNIIENNTFENNNFGAYKQNAEETNLTDYNTFENNDLDVKTFSNPPSIKLLGYGVTTVIIIAFIFLVFFFILAKKKK